MNTSFVHMLLIVLSLTPGLWAAVGCTLNDPDRDIQRLFKKASNYKTDFVSIKDHGGLVLVGEIEERLGDKLEPRYESMDVPYSHYTVLKGKEVIGYVHGVNQKGRYGGMQLIVASDPNGVILDFYYQKITSPEAGRFRDKAFTKQFKGLNLGDFYLDKPKKRIKDPTKKSKEDFLATFRGLRKNLILLDQFKLNRRYDEIWKKRKEGDDPNDISK